MKILIISEYFAPVQEIASIRWTKICKYLREKHQVEITLLTNKKNYDSRYVRHAEIDPLLEKDLDSVHEIWEVENKGLYSFYQELKNKWAQSRSGSGERNKNQLQEEGKAVRNAAGLPFMNCSQRRRTDQLCSDVRFLWSDYLRNHLFCKRLMTEANQKKLHFDVMISSFGPAWTHLIAEKIKKRNPDLFWIADFRDSYANDTVDGPLALRYHRFFTKKHCAKADIITRVNEEMRIFAPKGKTVRTLYNGYDPLERLLPLPPDKFTFVFTGTIYERGTNFRPLFHAVAELAEEKVMDIRDIRFEYAGRDGKRFLSQADEWGMSCQVKDFGVLPRNKALEMQQKAAVLIMAAANTKYVRCEWTGKIYEYMMAEKPIAYLISGDVPYSLPWKRIGLLGGVCYEACRHEETYPGLKTYVAEKYHEWKKTGNVSVMMDKEYISQFAYPEIAERVWKMIDSGTAGKT